MLLLELVKAGMTGEVLSLSWLNAENQPTPEVVVLLTLTQPARHSFADAVSHNECMGRLWQCLKRRSSSAMLLGFPAM